MLNRLLVGLLCLGLIPGLAKAQSVTLSGYLSNPGNTALVGSDLGAPAFGGDFEVANNVALYVISVPTGGTVNFRSRGFAAGGVDPYFTLFQGTGNSATFLGSNYSQAFLTGGDFNLYFTLVPGGYTLAIGAFANMSFAENFGAGTLIDGFIGLGEPDSLGNDYYELEITLGQQAESVPTLTEWGMIICVVLLAMQSVFYLRKRRSYSSRIR